MQHFTSHSGPLRQEIEEDNVKETLQHLCSHLNADVAQEAARTLGVLGGDTPL